MTMEHTPLISGGEPKGEIFRLDDDRQSSAPGSVSSTFQIVGDSADGYERVRWKDFVGRRLSEWVPNLRSWRRQKQENAVDSGVTKFPLKGERNSDNMRAQKAAMSVEKDRREDKRHRHGKSLISKRWDWKVNEEPTWMFPSNERLDLVLCIGFEIQTFIESFCEEYYV